MNELQRDAAEAPNGYVQIIAGPGTGKTVTLVNRACVLLRRGIEPHRLIIMSFTRAAAHEIRVRVAQKIDDPLLARAIQIGTFHSVAIRMIRKYSPPTVAPLSIINDSEQALVFEVLMHDLGWDTNPPSFFDTMGKGTASSRNKFLRSTLSTMQQEVRGDTKFANKTQLEYIDSLPKELHQFAAKYFERLAALNRVDFDGLLVKFYDMLRTPNLGDAIRSEIDAVLIDEFQDTSTLQLATSLELTARCHNLTVVGDPDQSIYGFRNANPRNFNIMLENTRDCQKCYLLDNYRSEQPILDVATQVIQSRARFAADRTLRARGPGAQFATPVQMLKCFGQSVHNSVRLTVKNVDVLVRAGVHPEEICILSRNSTSFGIYEAAFLSRNIKLRLVGGKTNLTDPKVMAVVCLLRVCLDPNDSLAIQHTFKHINPPITVTNMSQYGLVTISKLRALASTKRHFGRYLSVVDRFKSMLTEELSQKQTEPIGGLEFIGLRVLKLMIKSVSEYVGCSASMILETVDQFYEVCKDDAAFDEVLAGTEAQDALVFIEEYLRLWALGPQRQTTQPEQEQEKEKKCVTLSTIHSAKGLEWPVVFVVGYGNGAANFTDEEIRLFYVAITRAKSLLVLPNDGQKDLMEIMYGPPGNSRRHKHAHMVVGEEIAINLDALSACVGRELQYVPAEQKPLEEKRTNFGTMQMIDGFQFASSIERGSSNNNNNNNPRGEPKQRQAKPRDRSAAAVAGLPGGPSLGVSKRAAPSSKRSANQPPSVLSYFKPK